MSRTQLAFVAAATLAVAGCAPRYTYRPDENATARVGQHAAADYAIPSQAPQGEVRLASFGFSRIGRTNDEGNVKERALHLRMVLSNNGPQPWTVDTTKQLLVVPGGGRMAPSWASSRDQWSTTSPIITVPPGGKRTIDLFYRMPPGADKAAVVRNFDEIWQVQAGAQAVVERTSFDRIRVQRAVACAYGADCANDLAWGQFWYPDPVFMGAPNWM